MADAGNESAFTAAAAKGLLGVIGSTDPDSAGFRDRSGSLNGELLLVRAWRDDAFGVFGALADVGEDMVIFGLFFCFLSFLVVGGGVRAQ